MEAAIAASLMALPGVLAFDDTAEFQMLFRRVRSPPQQDKEKRYQTGKRGDSRKYFPQQTCHGCLWWLRMR
jgi:hypothetical protein